MRKIEKEKLKEIVDGLKCNELVIDPLNAEIVDLIRARKEDYFYDFEPMQNEEKCWKLKESLMQKKKYMKNK